jgi:hypothetical protein
MSSHRSRGNARAGVVGRGGHWHRGELASGPGEGTGVAGRERDGLAVGGGSRRRDRGRRGQHAAGGMRRGMDGWRQGGEVAVARLRRGER